MAEHKLRKDYLYKSDWRQQERKGSLSFSFQKLNKAFETLLGMEENNEVMYSRVDLYGVCKGNYSKINPFIRNLEQ